MTRKNGEGWIEKRGDRVRARYWVNGKKHTVGTFDSHEEADGALVAFASRLAAASPIAGETLDVWSRKWLDERELDGYHRDVKNDRHAFKRVTRAPIALLPLPAITPRDVRDWLGEQVKTGAAQQTIRNALNLLRVCLEAACEAGKIDRNPAYGIKVPRMARTDDGWTWLRTSEIDKLLEGDGEERDTFAAAIYTGVRAGELFGLEWRDIDVETGTAAIRHSWRGKPTKRGAARRVALLTPVLELLERQRARTGQHQHVFADRHGEGRTKDQIPDLKAALVAVGVTRRVRFHDLRHTCASHLLQGSWAPDLVGRALRLEEVKDWLGHTSIATTQRYAHLNPEAVAGLVVRTPPAAPPNAPKKVLPFRKRKKVSV